MVRAWIELGGEQAGWGPVRVLVAKLSRDGYAVQLFTGSGPKVLIITGCILSDPELLGHLHAGAVIPVSSHRSPSSKLLRSSSAAGGTALSAAAIGGRVAKAAKPIV